MDKAGLALNGRELPSLVKQVATANGLKDPDRIFVGDRIDLSMVVARAESDGASERTMTRTVIRPVAESTAPRPAHSLLDRTLSRAVEKGFLDPDNLAMARTRVLDLAKTYGFQPDDFARVVLLESDGFNPRASNGRCFGILQFCEGEGRGADSVGMRGRAAEITSRSVWEQLDYVERYLADVGGGASAAPKSLDDLYLAVLMPAARAQTSAQAALEIPGRQARLLHEGGDRARPITRDSLVTGLRLNAQQLLAADMPPRPSAAASGTTQLRMGSPLISTVQLPHWARPQPNFWPFKSKSFERICSKGS